MMVNSTVETEDNGLMNKLRMHPLYKDWVGMAVDVKWIVSSLLSHFPPVELVFAYGSAAIKQHGRKRASIINTANRIIHHLIPLRARCLISYLSSKTHSRGIQTTYESIHLTTLS